MTCEARLWMGGTERRCGQTVGLTRWYDATGVEHAGCFRHGEALRHRFPVADPPEPVWLEPEAPDAIDAYKAYTDAGYAPGEYVEIWGK